MDTLRPEHLVSSGPQLETSKPYPLSRDSKSLVLVQFERNYDLTAGNADVSSATRRRCEVFALLEKIVAVNSFALCAQGGRAVRAPSTKDLADLKLNQYQIPPDHSPTKRAPTKDAL